MDRHLDSTVASGQRASDADREAIADMLHRHHVEGRLDADELEAGAERCYASTTISELHDLVADLPSAPTPTREQAPRHAHGRVWIAVALATALVLGVLLAVGATHTLWLAAMPAAIALKRHRRIGHHRRCCADAPGLRRRVPASVPRDD